MKSIVFLVSVMVCTQLFAAAKPQSNGSASLQSNGSASPQQKMKAKDYMTISKVRVMDLTQSYKPAKVLSVEKSLTPVDGGWAAEISNATSTLNQVDLIVDKVINIGSKVWTVLDKGRPVQKFNKSMATALPQNAKSWEDLEKWNDPQSKVFGVFYENPYGMEVARFVYRVTYLAGGSANGVGHYIGYVNVDEVQFSTFYLYDFRAEASVEKVYNKNTKQDPIAGMILKVGWKVKTILKEESGSHSFTIDGLGNFTVAPSK